MNILSPNGNIVASQRFDGTYAGNYYFYDTDIRNSTMAILDENCVAKKYYKYDEYGKEVKPVVDSLQKYDEYGNLIQTKYYDEYCRQSGWIDYIDHGYPDAHTVPHWHEAVYDSTYPNGLIIHHRTSTAIPR